VRISRDKNGSPYIDWKFPAGSKRAWIKRLEPEEDWAKTGRYLYVARTEGINMRPGGFTTVFPIYSDLPDEEVLEKFVTAICTITGCPLPS
jgi:hypothetical protein